MQARVNGGSLLYLIVHYYTNSPIVNIVNMLFWVSGKGCSNYMYNYATVLHVCRRHSVGLYFTWIQLV